PASIYPLRSFVSTYSQFPVPLIQARQSVLLCQDYARLAPGHESYSGKLVPGSSGTQRDRRRSASDELGHLVLLRFWILPLLTPFFLGGAFGVAIALRGPPCGRPYLFNLETAGHSPLHLQWGYLSSCGQCVAGWSPAFIAVSKEP